MMKKSYIAPEMEIIRYTLHDVILASISEDSLPESGGSGIPSEIGGDELD